MSDILYTPQPTHDSKLQQFNRFYAARLGQEPFANYAALHAQSVRDLAGFWTAVRDFTGVKSDGRGAAFVPAPHMLQARFFVDANLNYAENLLERGDMAAEAVVFADETGVRARLTRGQLRTAVAQRQQLLRQCGVGVGDRVAACVSNIPEALQCMAATTASAALWSSCSPDFGAQGLVDRFGQISPKVLIVVDGYRYNGKEINILDKVAQALENLPSVRHVLVIGQLTAQPNIEVLQQAARPTTQIQVLPALQLDAEQMPQYVRVPFRYPAFILFSSGTTGMPKCIVHGHGGTLLQLMKEHQIQLNIQPNDRMFYYTTCSWMMWNYLVTALASEATLLLYDGAAFAPHAQSLFEYAANEKATIMGVSAKYLDLLRQENHTPNTQYNLDALRTILSTGSPLGDDCYDYVYQHIKADVHLSSIAGGTDIISCFMPGVCSEPVRRGWLQPAGLGMAVQVFNDAGHAVTGEKGELVCTQPFPSMPVCFFNDVDDAKYHAAYFERFSNVWTHGDFAQQDTDGALRILGRSDTVLNPGGVRIGTAEIYRVLERIPQVVEGLCVGQDMADDMRVVLFVVLRAGELLTPQLEETIKKRIRSDATPRHVPAVIVQVADIPRTKSGKITEQAVREIIHDRPVKNIEALANPDALNAYRNLPQLSV